MAINPNIALQGRGFNFAERFQQGQQNLLRQELLQSKRDASQQEVQRNRLLQELAPLAMQGDPQAQQAVAAIDPERAQAIQDFQTGQRESQMKLEANGALRVKGALEAGDLNTARSVLRELPQSGLRNRAMAALEQGDTETAMRIADQVVDAGTRMGILESGPSPVKLGEGSQLVDPRTGETIARGDDRRAPTGRFRSEVDQFGNVTIIDSTTGEIVRREGRPGAQAPQSGEGPKRRADGQGDVFGAVEEGTGPIASFRAGINNVIGPFMSGIPFEGTNRARAGIRNFNQEAKTALVNNPRFPVAEQKVVQEMLPDPSQFFQDPDAARQDLMELRTFLTNKRQQLQRSVQSGNVTQDEVGKLSNQMEAINRVLGLMGSPDGPQGEQGGEGRVIDFNDLPE